MQAPHWKMTPETTLLALMALERLHAAHLFLCRKCSHNILPLHNLQYGLNLPCSHVRRLIADAVTVNEGESMRSCTGILLILLKILFMSVIWRNDLDGEGLPLHKCCARISSQMCQSQFFFVTDSLVFFQLKCSNVASPLARQLEKNCQYCESIFFVTDTLFFYNSKCSNVAPPLARHWGATAAPVGKKIVYP